MMLVQIDVGHLDRYSVLKDTSFNVFLLSCLLGSYCADMCIYWSIYVFYMYRPRHCGFSKL